MRYFFHVSDGATTIADDLGSELSDPQTAMRQAVVLAAELADDAERLSGYMVCVVDAHGTAIGRVPIVPPIIGMRH